MATQTPTLQVQINSGDAEQRIARLRQALNGLNISGNNAAAGTDAASRGLTNAGNAARNADGSFRDVNGRLRDARGRFIAAGEAANTAASDVNNLGNAANRTGGLLAGLKGHLTGLISIATALTIAKTADEMQNLNSQIKLVTSSNEQYLAVQSRLKEMADKNRNDIGATIELYTNSARALSNMGKSQNEVLKFTNAFSLAMGVGGKSAQEQAAALRQLGQAMQSGVLRGDEFNSIAENAPVLLDLVSKSLHKTRGEIREMAADGKITAEVVYNAVSNATDQLQKQFDSMPVTMSQAFTIARNKYKEFTDQVMNGTGGISQTVAGMITTIAKNFDTLAKVTLVGAGLAFIQFAGTINVAAKAMAAFNLITKANPLVLIVSTILAVSSAFYGLDDVINTTSVIMGDLFGMIKDGWTGIFSLISDGTDWLQGKVAQSNSDVEKSYTDMFKNVTTKQEAFYTNAGFASNNLVKLISTDNMKNEQSYLGFYQKSEKGFTGLVQNLVGGVVAITAAFAGFFTWVGSHFSDLGKQIANAAMDVADFGREVIDAGKRKLGFDVKPRVKEQRYALTNMDARDAFAEFNREGQKWVHDYFSGLTARAATQPVAGMPPSMDYHPPKQSSSGDDDKDGKKKKKDDLQIQVFKAWKDAGLSAQQALLLTAEVGRENSYNPKNLFGYHEDHNNHKINMGMLSWQGSRAVELKKYLTDAGVLKGGKIEHSQESLNAMAQFAVKEILTKSAYAKTKNIFLANPNIDNQAGFNVLGSNYIAWDMAGKKIDASKHIARRNGYYNQIAAKVGDKDLVSSFMEQTKAHDDYVNSIATGEAKIRAELAKTIEGLPKKGFSGQALEDEKKRLTEEAQFDILLFKETNRQKLDELMGVNKTKKDQILDESTLQSLTIAADESKSREQRKAEMDALDKGTQEKLRLNDIVNKTELNHIYAYRKTSSELIADEWDEKIASLTQYNGIYKEEWRKAFEEQKQRALDIDKIQLDQQLLDLNQYKYSSFAFIDERLKLELEAIAKTTDAEVLKQAKIVDAKKKAEKDKKDAEEKQRVIQAGLDGDLFGADNPILKMKDGLRANDESRNDRLNMAADMFMNGQIDYKKYTDMFSDITAAHINNERKLWIDGYGGIFSDLSTIVGGFAGKQSKAYRVMFAIEKGFAIAKSVMAIQTAMASATASLSFPANLPVIAQVAAQGANIVATIQSVREVGFKTGGYTGNVGVNDVAGVVHGKEYVLNAQATRNIGLPTLNAMNSGKMPMGSNVQVNNYGSNKVDVRQENGLTIIDVREEIDRQVKSQMTNPNSVISKSIIRNTTARPQR